jgi:hypothetical protein
MLALFALASVSTTPLLAQSKVLALRGGMDLGPINADNTGGFLKVAAAVTAAGAITEKYAGLEETSLTKFFKGEVWTTNLIISLVTGVAANVLYSVGASDFNSGKLTSALWLAGVLLKLKDSPDIATVQSNLVETVVAILLALQNWL